MADDTNKPEKLGFVRLYNTRLPIAKVEVQHPNALRGIGTIKSEVNLSFIAHYCWEGKLLLVSEQIMGAPVDWLDKEHDSPRISSHACATETVAVDRIIRMKGEAWEQAHRRVESAIAKHKPLRAIRFDCDGVIQEDPEPEPGKAEESTVSIQVNGERPVTMSDKQFRDLPGKIRKLASSRQAVAR